MKQFRGLRLMALPTLTMAVLAGFSSGACYAQSGGQVAAGAGPLFLRTLHVTGFLQNTSATWIDSEAIEYVPSKNSLASERNLIQVDVNDDITENDSMFARLTGVYEPSYPFENSCSDANHHTVDCNADFHNFYGIREFWLTHRTGPLRVFVGRQIVAWGESLAFRIADQINPQDLTWAFGFVNLENSRNPLWMFHPILNLPSAGPLSSNFAELVYIPGFDYAYTQVDFTDDALDGQDQVAGRINVFPATPGARFTVRTDTRTFPAGSTFANALAFAPPLYLVRALPGCPPPGLCAVVAGGAVGIFTTDVAIPRATWGNSQIGVRLHTLAFNTEMAAFWLWNHEYDAVIKFDPEQISAPAGPNVPFRQERAREIFPQYMGAGMTANRPLYLPGALSQLPFVVRAEAFYKNHAAFGTLNIPGDVFVGFNPAVGAPSGLVRSDEVLWLFALDLDQAYAPWLTSTGNLTANLEIAGTTVLSYSHRMIVQGSFEHVYHNDVNVLLSVGTSWLWGAVAPTWTDTYNPNGETFLFFPTIQLTPPWTNKYFMKLGYVGILGTNKFGFDGGVFKGKSLLYAQFQYNFSLM